MRALFSFPHLQFSIQFDSISRHRDQHFLIHRNHFWRIIVLLHFRECDKGEIMFVIGVINQKGGVGKTTTSVNLAAGLSSMGYEVKLIDGDPQASALDWNAARQADSLFPVIGLPRATIHKDIEKIGRGFDFVIIDGPPRVTDLARSVIMASDLVIIPVQPSPYDIWGSDEAIKLIAEASVYKENLKSCFLINRKIANTAIGRDVVEALSVYPIPVLTADVCQRVAFPESAGVGMSVFETDPDGKAAAEMMAVIKEIQERFVNE
jgi:chromosome partitioning protein